MNDKEIKELKDEVKVDTSKLGKALLVSFLVLIVGIVVSVLAPSSGAGQAMVILGILGCVAMFSLVFGQDMVIRRIKDKCQKNKVKELD